MRQVKTRGRHLSKRIFAGVEPPRASDGLKDERRTGDLAAAGSCLSQLSNQRNCSALRWSPSEVRNVVPRPHQQPNPVRDRLAGLHRRVASPSDVRILQAGVVERHAPAGRRHATRPPERLPRRWRQCRKGHRPAASHPRRAHRGAAGHRQRWLPRSRAGSILR